MGSEETSGKKEEAPFPQDESAMKAYSLAVAHSAEGSEPDLPTGFGTESEKSGSDDIGGAIFSHMSKNHMSGSMLGIDLI